MTELNVNTIAETDENKDLLLGIARDANGWDGSFDDIAAYDMAELDEILSGMAPSEIINKVVYGDAWTPSDEYFRFDGYENLESVSEYALRDEAWDQREELLEWAVENPSRTDVNLDDFETED